MSDHRPRRVISNETRIGLLTVSPKGYRVQKRVRRWMCRCDCGATTYLSTAEIERRGVQRTGCCSVTCTATPIEVAVSHNPSLALRLQIRHLLALCPEDVDPAWGGTACDSTPNPDGVRQFLDDLLPLVDLEKKAWWLRKFNQKGMWTVSNTVFGRRPALSQFDPKSVYISGVY